MKLVALAALLVACGGNKTPPVAPTPPPKPTTLADRTLALLPEGAQVIIEVDLARLRANQVVGGVATQMLGDIGADAKLPGLPMSMQGSPLAHADYIVLAAYGVGTANAATVTFLGGKLEEVADSVRLADDLIVIGPVEWTNQIEARNGIAQTATLVAGTELLALRDHAMPDKAPGAVLRVTANLPFDARVALARMTGVELAPARLSVWADFVDDFAMIVDADASDPGDKPGKDAVARLTKSVETLFTAVANEPLIRTIGVPYVFTNAKYVQQGTWVRAIVQIGPRQLARAAERARAMLGPAS